MKTKEELNAIKEEVETLNKKLAELTEEELKTVTGGSSAATRRGSKMKKYYCINCGYIKETFPESITKMGSLTNEHCPECNAINSFAIGDLDQKADD